MWRHTDNLWLLTDINSLPSLKMVDIEYDSNTGDSSLNCFAHLATVIDNDHLWGSNMEEGTASHIAFKKLCDLVR